MYNHNRSVSLPGISKIILISAIVLSFFSCSEYQKVLKSTNYDTKFEMGVKYFDKKDYFRASSLFEELLPIFKGTRKAEKVLYYYAYCQYHMGDYMMSAYYFESFVRTYSNSEFAEECLYMSAESYSFDSPVYSLDQSNTYKAISQIELFVSRYPQSARIKGCNELLDKLRIKLETKAFEQAKLYYNTEEYKASTWEFRNLLKDFPDTKYREEAYLFILKSNYNYASNSILEKKKERFQLTVESYNQYVDAFPSGKYLKEAQGIFESTVKQIEKVSRTNS